VDPKAGWVSGRSEPREHLPRGAQNEIAATDFQHIRSWVERALNLRPGDFGRGMLLCSYLFLIISSYVVGKVASDALFLGRFQAVQLPYVDIALAVLVTFVTAGYLRLGRWISLRNLLVGALSSSRPTAAYSGH